MAVIVLLALCGYWYIKARARREPVPDRGVEQSPQSRAQSTALARDPQSDFDITIELDGDPLGVAWGDGEFVIGNRITPWGFIRLRRTSEWEFERAEKAPVREPTYNQQINVWTVTWNGKEYVGYADGSWFGSAQKKVFTVHDPKTLNVTGYHPAPELIGGLAWDGSGYWAATRRNTADSGEPVFLYRLDSSFRIVTRYEPPGIGCQGLVWDGTLLWFVDVFSGDIHMLNVDNIRPKVVHTYHTRFDYLSGVAFDGANIWITEYGGKRLHRLNPQLKEAWEKGDFQIARYEQAVAALRSASSETADGESIEKLLKQLRDDPYHTRDTIQGLERLGAKEQAIEVLQEMVKGSDDSVHQRAKSALKDLGVPPRYDRYSNSLTPGEGDAGVKTVSAEIASGTLRASWRIRFGSELLAGVSKVEGGAVSMPAFAKYTVTVKGGSLASPLVKEYEAREGDNVRSDEELASGLGRGRYFVEVFIHVQYVDRQGANKILNRSVPALEVGW